MDWKKWIQIKIESKKKELKKTRIDKLKLVENYHDFGFWVSYVREMSQYS